MRAAFPRLDGRAVREDQVIEVVGKRFRAVQGPSRPQADSRLSVRQGGVRHGPDRNSGGVPGATGEP